MIEEITTDFGTITEYAPAIVSYYLDESVQHIDEKFGVGYAENNPTLLGMFILASAIGCTGAMIAQQTRAGLSEVGSGFNIDVGIAKSGETTDFLDESRIVCVEV